MIQRLRDLLAHARAGHRIGCETCAEWRTGIAYSRARMTPEVRRVFDHFDGIVGPNGIERPHTLYVADPDELRRSGDL